MKLKFICYLKSGAVVSDEIEFVESATVQDANNTRIKCKDFINNGIKEKLNGTFTFGFTHINIQEISAYSLKIEEAN